MTTRYFAILPRYVDLYRERIPVEEPTTNDGSLPHGCHALLSSMISTTHSSYSMASLIRSTKILPPLLLLLLLLSSISISISTPETPIPTPWPLQFHSILFMNYSGALSLIDLWYDWPNGRNFNIIQNQLGGPPLYDLEWNNGTSFFYTLPASPSPSCRTAHLDVGILRPDWLDGATYLGQQTVDGFLCNVWEKVEFIWYYEDVATKRPVHWVFYTGRSAHVMTFEVGAVLDDAKWQAPVYCFEKGEEENPEFHSVISQVAKESSVQKRSLMRGLVGF